MAKGLRICVLASGRGSNLQALLDAAKEGKIRSRVVVVVSDVFGADALQRAAQAGIPSEALTPDPQRKGAERRREQEGRIRKVLAHFKVDLVVLAGYMRLVSAEFVQAFKGRLVNIHPGLLPSFPGLDAQKQAVEWGARIAGCTTHYVDEETDHGPILLQAAVPVLPSDTRDLLASRILELEHQLLPRTVHLIEQGRVVVEGRRALLRADESWTKRYPTVPGALYGPGY